MKKCDLDSETLMAYLDGELSALERGRVAEHIVACEPCRTMVNDLRDVTSALQKWGAPDPVSMPSATAILERAGVETVAATATRAAKPLRAWWAVAAALAAVAVVTALVAVPALRSTDTQVATSPAPSAEPPSAATLGAPDTVSPDATQSGPGAGNQKLENSSGAAATGPQGPADAEPSEPAASSKEEEAKAGSGTVGFVAGDAADREERKELARQEAPPAPPPPAAEPQAPKPANETAAVTAAEEADDLRDAPSNAAGGAARAKTARRAPASRASQTFIRSGRVRISGDDADALANRVAAAATSAGGRVTSRSRAGRGALRVVVEVPADQFDRAYAQIKSLGPVRGEMLSNRDVGARLRQIDGLLASRDEGSRRDNRSTSDLERERVELLDRATRATIEVTIVGP